MYTTCALIATVTLLGGNPLTFPEGYFQPPEYAYGDLFAETMEDVRKAAEAESLAVFLFVGTTIDYESSTSRLKYANADLLEPSFPLFAEIEALHFNYGKNSLEGDPVSAEVAGAVMTGTFHPEAFDLVLQQYLYRGKLWRLYLGLANPDSLMQFLSTATFGTCAGRNLYPDMVYGQPYCSQAMYLKEAYQVTTYAAEFNSSTVGLAWPQVQPFLESHLGHFLKPRQTQDRVLKPSAAGNSLCANVLTILECVREVPADSLIAKVKQVLTATELTGGEWQFFAVQKTLRRCDAIQTLREQSKNAPGATESSKPLAPPLQPVPEDIRPRLIKLCEGGQVGTDTNLTQAFLEGATDYIPMKYHFHDVTVMAWEDDQVAKAAFDAYSGAIENKLSFGSFAKTRSISQDLQNLVASTCDHDLHETLLYPPEAVQYDAFSPTGVSVRLLYLAKVNPETTLDALLRCGKQADEKSDYIYDTRTAQPADGRDTARTERRYIATWKEAFEILSYMADVSPEALRARADDARRFVADYAFLYANRSTRAGSGESYSPWNDFHMRNFALDVMAVVGTKDDAELIHRLGNEIRDVDFIEFYQDIVDRQHAHLKDKAAGLLEKTGE